MRLTDAISGVIPINSQTADRAPVADPVPIPEVGQRFGKASAFSFSAEGKRASGGGSGAALIEDEPTHYARIIPAQAKVMSQLVRIEDPEDPETFTEVERLSRMMFYFTEYPAKPTRASPQPSRTTYYDLRFALHPAGETEVAP